MSTQSDGLPLFAGTGVELEYMIVDAASLEVRPMSDELIRAMSGVIQSDVERGSFCWSNELVLHVIEFKTNGPAATLTGLARGFQAEVVEANRQLAAFGARLMPSAMHPWMDPHTQTRLWPHEYSPVYEAYNRIFGCQGHGWSNLQSMHLNFPFNGNAEFGALHAAIRALLPLLPALAASSPVMDGRVTGFLDNRLSVYRTNSARIPSITGRVIPEPCFTQTDYERDILHRMYRDIAPHDPEGILQDEFLNSRGAIARFDRGSIEIRVLDIQECPAADVAIAQIIKATLQSLVAERWEPLARIQSLPMEPLEQIFLASCRLGEVASIKDPNYLAVFGWPESRACTAADLWRWVLNDLTQNALLEADTADVLRVILDHGPLARRILRALGGDESRHRLSEVYQRLCVCLAEGRLFRP